MTWTLAVIACTGLVGCDLLFTPSPGGSGDAGQADAPPLIDGPFADSDGDLDDDGHADGADNCPAVANADQHDEDDDGRGDVCDNCPVNSNFTQENADGDGLGDACFDNDATFDCVGLFDGFVDIDGWMVISGTWSVSAGTLYQSDADAVNASAVTLAAIPDGYVLSYATVQAASGSSAQHILGILGRTSYVGPHTFPDGVLFEALNEDPPGTDTTLSAAYATNDSLAVLGGFPTIMPPHGMTSGDQVSIGIDLRDPGVWTGFLGVQTSGANETFTGRAAISGGVGVRTSGASVGFAWMMSETRYASGPCPPTVFP